MRGERSRSSGDSSSSGSSSLGWARRQAGPDRREGGYRARAGQRHRQCNTGALDLHQRRSHPFRPTTLIFAWLS